MPAPLRLEAAAGGYNGRLPPLEFHGVFAEITTPFDHAGEIYRAKIRHNIGRLNRTRLSGCVVGGGWGEGALLSSAERVRLWREAAEQAEDERAVLAAVGGCGVAEARALCAEAAEAGCRAVLLAAPDLSRTAPSSGNAGLFFRAVADKAALPLVIDAALGGKNALAVDEIARLAAHPGIGGALVSAEDPVAIQVLCAKAGSGFAVLVRGIRLMDACLAAGACAAVSAMAAAVPFHCLSIEEAVRTREFDAARELIDAARELDALLAAHGAPALKHALDLRGHYGGAPRLPLLPLPAELQRSIAAAMRELAG